MIDENGPEIAEAIEIAQAHLRARRFEAAHAVFGKVLSIAPQHLPALSGMAGILLATGQTAAALPLYAQVLAQDPENDEAETNRSVIYFQFGDPVAAEFGFRRVVERRPDQIDALHNLARCVLARGRAAEAAALWSKVMALAPDDPRGPIGLGQLAIERGDPVTAEHLLRRALRADPFRREAAAGLIALLQAAGLLGEAMAAVNQALLRHPGDGDFELVRGHLLMQAQRIDEAVEAFEAARQAGNAAAPLALARAQMLRGASEAAQLAFLEAVTAAPHDREAKFGFAMALYQAGQLARAGRLIDELGRDARAALLRQEMRLIERSDPAPWSTVAQGHAPPAAIPPDDTLLIDAAGGDMTDLMLYLRLAEPLAQRCGKVVVRCGATLTPVVRRVTGVAAAIEANAAPPAGPVTVLPLAAVPLAAGAAPYELPFTRPYLTPDPARARPWPAELFAGNQPRIGLAWQRTGQRAGPGQALLLDHLEPVLALHDLRLFSLGGPADEDDRRRLSDLKAVDVMALGRDFDDVAAAIAELDLVIAVDNAMAHIAGALGCEVWLLLPVTPHWRWGRNGQATTLYPHFRLFRQETAGSWGGAVDFIAAELKRRYGIGPA